MLKISSLFGGLKRFVGMAEEPVAVKPSAPPADGIHLKTGDRNIYVEIIKDGAPDISRMQHLVEYLGPALRRRGIEFTGSYARPPYTFSSANGIGGLHPETGGRWVDLSTLYKAVREAVILWQMGERLRGRADAFHDNPPPARDRFSEAPVP